MIFMDVYCNYCSQLEMYQSSSNCFVKELDDVHGVVVYCNYCSQLEMLFVVLML